MKTNPRVLIVDDQDDNRFTLKIVLKNENYDFIEAVNGEDAVAKAIEYSPDIILMDAVMPIMDGFEATKAIRNIGSLERTPILMVTALSEKEDRIHALESGVNDFVSKPFDKHEVIARCRSYVNMAQLNDKYINATENAITHLPNRAALIDDLSKMAEPIVILFAIDDHENLMDFYSDEIMHTLEKEVANLACKEFPIAPSQYSFYNTKYGEFAFVIDNVLRLKLTKDLIEATCKEFYTKIRQKPIRFNDYEFIVSITLGISINESSPLDNARTALKMAHKNKLSFLFAEDVIERVHKEVGKNIEWIKKIKIAINNNKIVPYFQPIYNNHNDTIEKYESLIRLIDEEGEVISPFFFLEIAQKGKYYHQLTRIMFDKSIAVFQNKEVEFSINLSGSDIENTELREYILKKLETNPKIASKIVFELLEDETFDSFDTLKTFVTTVKKYGAKIAIDDFGSGYSNFTRLMEYQPDILKIDGSLIKNIDNDEFSLHIVKTIKTFADQMGIKIVAEFVHSEAVFKIVKELGIDYTQGYFISPPISAQELNG
ncbi:MAG: EAL domain-containing protein [Sulfuricurvum sp.]|nr:EAL domain-containing protein [Sulfuricurvum sp.]